VLDLFDRLDLWKDTMLIVNADHGCLLGEHGFWGKNSMPFYDEIVRLPLFVWDPRFGKKNEARDSLAQTIDIPASILEYFGIERPRDMQGLPLAPLLRENKPLRNTALFGMHGSYTCCTDGRYVYMKAPATRENKPLYQYTLLPMSLMGFFSPQEMATMELAEPFPFTKGMRLMRFEPPGFPSSACDYGDLLFDTAADPGELHPLRDNPLVVKKMREEMVSLMEQNNVPVEQYERLGLTGYRRGKPD
jgi:arylsulfatase A-like enzyme